MTETSQQIVLFTSHDGAVSIPATLERESVWLTQAQISELFGKERSVITKHIGNAIKEGEVEEESVCAVFAHTAADGKTYQVVCYNLEVIISVGYRVKSQRGVEFRRWANSVLRKYILQGYALNEPRLQALGQVFKVLRRAENLLDAQQVLSVVERYSAALELLDNYDHQRVAKPAGKISATALTYDECRTFVDAMKLGVESHLFGLEKDQSFQGSIGAIYQTVDGLDVYPSVEEKAANLLYFIVKNHSFVDGNKRIGAAIFLYFLNKHGFLLDEIGGKRIEDNTLVALTIMIAESRPAEREIMLNLVMTFLLPKVP